MSRVFRVQNSAPRASVVARTKDHAPTVEIAAPDPAQILSKSKETAERIVATARGEAASIVEAAGRESASLRQSAAEEGRTEGFERGYETGIAEASGLVERAKAVLEEATAAFDAMLADAEPKLLALAISAAKKVACDSLRTDPDVALEVIRKGMAALRDESEFSLRVDPDIMPLLGDTGEGLAREFGARSVEVVADPEAAGGAVVKTPHGFVDVRISSQIANIAAAISEARHRAVEAER